MFGIDDLLIGILGAGYAGKESLTSGASKNMVEKHSYLTQKFLEQNTDRELEDKLLKEIEDISCYDDIWSRLEAYKIAGGVYSKPMYQELFPFWKSVCKERLPFRDNKGRLHPPTNYEDMLISGNRNGALSMLMQTYGKLTIKTARRLTSDMDVYALQLIVNQGSYINGGAPTLEQINPDWVSKK